jgi:hypothetical protein
MKTTDPELDRLIREQEEADDREKSILARLLQKVTDRKGYVLVHASAMGKVLTETGSPKLVPSFAATHSLEWIADNIKLGSQMPFMETKIDPVTMRLIIDQENAEEVKQRAPDWTRQPALAAYLAQPQRKFGPIIAVVSPDWVDNPNHENWDKSGRALKSATEFTALDLEGRVGLLKLDGIKVYALDGQHRVIGIQGIRDVRDKPLGLVMRTKDGKEKGRAYSREEFLGRFHLSFEDLQALLNETIIVEYLPAVIAGETRSDASRRIRNTFISINSYAKKTDKGENILLDETDGYSIIARKAGVFHALFNGSGRNNRVNWKTTSIPKQRSEWYTTLQTIKDMARHYLSAIDPARAEDWSVEFRDQMPIRPSEADLDAARDEFFGLLERVHQLPVFQILEKGDADRRPELVTRWREFPTESEPDNKGHLLLRPVGQLLLAEAVGTLVKPRNLGGRGMKIEDVFAKIAKLDSSGGFEAHRPENVWYGVTYDDKDKKMITSTSARSLAHDLFVYLVAGLEEPDLTQLWVDFATARLVDHNKKTWRPLDGGDARSFDEGKIELPNPV